MIWRAAREEDFPACLEIEPRHAGYELVGAERGLKAWKSLVRSCSFKSAIIEANPPIAGLRLIGFGASAFVRRTFADEELSNPRPGLNSRIIESVDRGDPVVLDRAALRAANTDGGLDLAVFGPQWRNDILDAQQVREVQTLLISAFVERHRGYRLRRFLMEVVDETESAYSLHPGGAWRAVSDFGVFYAEHPHTDWNRDRWLAIISEEEAFQMTGHVTGMLFQYREPVLGLSEADQELLEAAIEGLTDEELANRLQKRLPAIKKRWRSVFERASARQDLLPGLNDGFEGGARGRQKRHSVLAYVREHPEELRPFSTNKRLGRS